MKLTDRMDLIPNALRGTGGHDANRGSLINQRPLRYDWIR